MGEIMEKLAAVVCLTLVVAGCTSAVEEDVREQLIDPNSAEFKDVRTCDGDDTISVGQVNGKNRMGAYTGFEPFFHQYGIVYFASDPRFSEKMDQCYSDLGDIEADAMEAVPGGEKPKTGAWRTNTDRDPIDDTAVITATLDADTGRARFGDPVTLVARCGSNKTELYAIWNTYVGDDSQSVYNEYKNVEVRVGDAAARTERWGVSTDKQATFAGGAVPLLREMSGAEQLVLRMTPYGENPITAIFKLEGFRDAIEPIAKECSWEL